MRRDPRITRVGGLLRRYSLDELPQLLNVRPRTDVAGRPASCPARRRSRATASTSRHRLVVKPGLTGLWQVSGRSDLSWDESVRLDLHYVDNWSLALDVQIVLRTVRAVLSHSRRLLTAAMPRTRSRHTGHIGHTPAHQGPLWATGRSPVGVILSWGGGVARRVGVRLEPLISRVRGQRMSESSSGIPHDQRLQERPGRRPHAPGPPPARASSAAGGRRRAARPRRRGHRADARRLVRGDPGAAPVVHHHGRGARRRPPGPRRRRRPHPVAGRRRRHVDPGRAAQRPRRQRAGDRGPIWISTTPTATCAPARSRSGTAAASPTSSGRSRGRPSSAPVRTRPTPAQRDGTPRPARFPLARDDDARRRRTSRA